MAEVLTFFLFIGAMVFAGFLGTLFFKKTRFSDFILLMLLGLLIGPVFGLLGSTEIVFLKGITPFFASLALVILLFEGGLKLNFYQVLHELSEATVFTVLVFVLSVALVASVLILAGWSVWFAVLAGCVLGGSCSAIVLPLVNASSVKSKTKTLLTIESALTDALVVVATIAVAQVILAGTMNVQGVAQGILAAFSIAAVLGFGAGVLWLVVLRDFHSTREYQYVLTVGVLFLVFGLAEFVGGNGAFSALVFGLVLGNAREIGPVLRMKPVSLSSEITGFQTEISLFVRTFFFVYLGIIFDLVSLTWGIVLVSVFITLVLFVARSLGTGALSHWVPDFFEDKLAIRALMGRGLAAAVLATYPMAVGIVDANVGTLIQIVFLVILFSAVVTTVEMFRFEKFKKKLLGNQVQEVLDGKNAEFEDLKVA